MLSYTESAVMPGEASTYIASAGLPGWPADEAEQTRALLRAQRWMASAYNKRWTITFDNDDAPDLVRFAIVEAAILEARQPGSLSTAPRIENQDKVLTRAGPLGWTPREKGENESAAVRVAHIEEMLAPLLTVVGKGAAAVVV